MAQQSTARTEQSGQSVAQALALHREGRLDEAERIYRRILAAEPAHPEALHLSGLLNYQQGRLADALRLLAAAMRAKPSSSDAQMDYTLVLTGLGRHDEALASLDELAAHCADDARWHFNRANAQKELGRYSDALQSYEQAIALSPALFVAHHNRGSALAALDRHEEALASFDRALTLDLATADRIGALINRGKMLVKLKRFDEALASFDRVLDLAPDHVDALTRRGVVLAKLGRYEEALAVYAAALRADPDCLDAYVNRGNAFAFMNRFDAALADFAAATARQPDHPGANFNESLVRLCLGDFRRGWEKYEYRWQCGQYALRRPKLPRPVWRGDIDPRGKTILLYAEQGMGDAIQFVRYAPLLAARGAKVIVGVHRPLAALMTGAAGVAAVIADGQALPDFDLYCPMLSLPLAFGTEFATIPSTVPYIRPQPDRIAQWQGRLPQTGRLRIGICWAGTAIHPNDERRSIPLEAFATILSVRDVDFVSLQRDVNAAQAAILEAYGVAPLGQEFADFADTAAVVSMLDLIISVDTAVAHLAGAMAKAVGLLVPFSPDFRWMLRRTDSPWYPTMRLFRQTAIGEWDGPLNRLREELAGIAASRRQA